jgi:hypothetical protein
MEQPDPPAVEIGRAPPLEEAGFSAVRIEDVPVLFRRTASASRRQTPR